MQLAWLFRGLRTGVVTSPYPRGRESSPEGFRGRPVLDPTRCRALDGCDACARACLPGAIDLAVSSNGHRQAQLRMKLGSCIMCGLCVVACPSDAMAMTPDDELAARDREDLIATTDLIDEGDTP